MFQVILTYIGFQLQSKFKKRLSTQTLVFIFNLISRNSNIFTEHSSTRIHSEDRKEGTLLIDSELLCSGLQCNAVQCNAIQGSKLHKLNSSLFILLNLGNHERRFIIRNRPVENVD